MNKRIRKIIDILKKKKIVTASAAVIIAAFIVFLVGGNGVNSYDFIVAQRRDVSQGVSITGQVKPVQSVDLAFEQTGTVAQVLADVGDTVIEGQTLVTLRNGDIVALLNQADAQADVERADLADLKNNADAQQDLTNSYNDVLNTINDALAKAEDAVRSKTAGLLSGSVYAGYSLTFSTCEGATSKKASTLRLKTESELDKWNRELDSIGTNESRLVLDRILSDAQSHLDIVGDFVDALNTALLTNCATDNSTLDTGRTSMATAQTNVLTAIDNINNLQQKIASEKVTEENSDDIRAQEARVQAAEAGVENYRAQLTKTIIRSPINGVVTRQDANVGETVSLNVAIVSVISAASFEIEANIPEVEIAKIQTGAGANVTLDAYGDNEVFGARVSMIDPAETIISGVPNYKTTLVFNEEDERIKSGMTANIDIFLEHKTSVIAVPRGAVEVKDGKKFVKIIVGERRNVEAVDIEVITGITGSDGFVEIVSGVNEGDRIILPTN